MHTGRGFEPEKFMITILLTLLTIIATYLRVWLNKPHVGSPETTHAVYPVSECETQFICAVIQVTGYY